MSTNKSERSVDKMSDERGTVHEVTKFLLNTCRLRPQLTKPALQALVQCCVTACEHAPGDVEVEKIPLRTGSVAEFYIEPMLPRVGDIDVMYHWSIQLAIPRGHPPPTQLPDEFHNYVNVFEIIDSHFPGYVYLAARYLLTECDDQSTYSALVRDEQIYAFQRCHYDAGENHGPALTYKAKKNLLPVDYVPCMRCLSWPPQAADWPTRHRNYDWPDSATVDHVVSSGCDVVRVAHRQCKHDEWMSMFQWRLSFSRAEIVLLNSWMPVQQIVYHMLRVFVKTAQLTDSVNNSKEATLSNYHIKTLVLWACEVNSNCWWTDDLSLVRICVELLHTLADWLTDGRCPHYFIHNCNLIDNSFYMELIANQLMSVDKAWLSTWFVNNYILKCAELCPDSVKRLLDEASTIDKLEKAFSAIVDWRQNNTLYECWITINRAEIDISAEVSKHSLPVRSCVYWMILAKFDTHLTPYFTGVAFLHVTCKISRNGLNDELMDVLATIVGQFPGTRGRSTQRSVLSLSQAAKLMKVIANSSLSTVQLIEIELSKAYLYRALRCKDSDSDFIYCLANVYLAVLYYTTGQYQTVIDHCTLVMRSQDHSQCSSHVVQGELLPKFDDVIDNVLGLAVFYQYVRTTALNQQQRQYVSLFTTKLFAHYLLIRCLSKCCFLTQISHVELHQYRKCLSDMQLIITDMLVLKSIKLFLSYHCQSLMIQKKHLGRDLCQDLCQNLSESNMSTLVDLLQQSAVEHLTTFRQIEARDFSSVAAIVTTDFEALYAYKHGDYQRCLQLSTQNVCSLLHVIRYLPVVLMFPEIIQLLDDDLVSLTALTLIVNPKCRDRPIGGTVRINQLTLSLYLMAQCQMKLYYSLASLAQTLDYIQVAQIGLRFPVDCTLDLLTLKLAARLTTT